MCRSAQAARTPTRCHGGRDKRRRCGWSLLLLSLGCVTSSWVYADATRSDIHRLQAELAQMRQAWQRSNEGYESRISELEQRLAELESAGEGADTSHELHGAPHAGGPTVRLSTMVAAGGSDQDDRELQLLQAGSHDPNRNGFTVQLVGLALQAPLGAHAYGRASITTRIDADNESKTELEEAYLVSEFPDAQVELKAGHFFTEFGYLNPRHAHDWAFVDKPVILTRLFGGDALRNPGVQVAYGATSATGLRVSVGAQHPAGETAHSFLSAPGEDIGGHTLTDREVQSLGDLLYSARLAYGAKTEGRDRWRVGVSGLWGPNATAVDSRTAIYGIDWGRSWRAGASTVDWNTEMLWRRYETGPGAAALKDWGGYTQLVWQFDPNWLAGLRLGHADAQGNNRLDPFRDRRTRASVELGWLGDHGTSVRLQYNHDRADHLDGGDANAIWLQLRYALGADEHHDH